MFVPNIHKNGFFSSDEDISLSFGLFCHQTVWSSRRFIVFHQAQQGSDICSRKQSKSYVLLGASIKQQQKHVFFWQELLGRSHAPLDCRGPKTSIAKLAFLYGKFLRVRKVFAWMVKKNNEKTLFVGLVWITFRQNGNNSFILKLWWVLKLSELFEQF